MAKPKVLILQRASTSIVYQTVQCLAAAGTFEVHYLTNRPKSPIRFSRFLRSVHYLESCDDDLSLLKQLKSFLREHPMDVLLTINEEEIDFIIRNADEELRSMVRLPEMPSEEMFRIASSKVLLGSFMEEHNIPYPRSVCVDLSDPAGLNAVKDLRFPVIIKPDKGWGGIGMIVFESHSRLVDHLKRHPMTQPRLLVQEFLTGSDHGCAVYCEKGKVLYSTIQEKIPVEPYLFGASKAVVFRKDPEVEDIARQLMEALTWNGIAQIDVFEDQERGGYYVLEINPRYWGTLYGSLRSGLNFPEIICRKAMGLEATPMKYRPKKFVKIHGYLHILKARLTGKKLKVDFNYSDSNIPEMFSDPLYAIVDLFGRL